MKNSKYSISSLIKASAKELNKEVQEISKNSLDALYEAIGSKYTDGLNYPLWQGMSDSISIRDEQGWLTIRSLIANEETILFVEPNDERYAIKSDDGNDLVEILDNSSYFTFYITNPDFDFLLAYNDHDFLIAKGEKAQKWMKANYSSLK